MPEAFRRPLGLALAGGGAFGSWQLSLLAALCEAGLVFDEVLGFSAGSLSGAAYALGRMEEGLETWGRMDGGILRFSPRLSPFSIFSDLPIRQAAGPAGDEEAARRDLRCRLVVASARVSRDKLVYASFTPGGREGWDGPLLSHLLASCAIPRIFPPVRLNYRGQEELLWDGGIPTSEAFSFRELSRCADVLVIETVSAEERLELGWNPIANIDRRGRRTIRRLMDEGIASLSGASPRPRVFRVSPSAALGSTMLDFSARRVRPALEQGRRDARDFLALPERRLVAA